ncbi:MAG: hypothetical protein AMJ94_00750 [Deltaproteobacteria bacterium SM23_61]|nr:MAG: hypothetical protein AMJ94_00750 [Deltaproteobacteria bacterium SM23_61]
MQLFTIVLGLILLVFGRRLFWLFVALVGFILGMEFTGVILGDQPKWVMLFIGLGTGLIGALLAVFIERLAFALAGFYAGAYLALIGAQSFGVESNTFLLCAVSGFIGAVFAALIMDWVIILLSCLVGAGAIVVSLGLDQMARLLVFVALAAAGAVFQAKVMARSRKG